MLVTLFIVLSFSSDPCKNRRCPSCCLIMYLYHRLQVLWIFCFRCAYFTCTSILNKIFTLFITSENVTTDLYVFHIIRIIMNSCFNIWKGPDDELFPAQEALLHIQSRIVDLGPDKDNVIITRLLVPATEIGCLEGRDGSLTEIRKLTRTNIEILPREQLPICLLGTDELVQVCDIPWTFWKPSMH